MDKKIFLPDAEMSAKLIEDAWQAFKKQAAEGGLDFDTNPQAASFAKDMFVSGYCYGHNDCLEIIRGQLQAMDIVDDMFKPNKGSDTDKA